MSQAIIKPEEVRKFASKLKGCSEAIRGEQQKLTSGVRSLGSTWRDQEFRKFETEFQQASKAITKFLESSDKYVQHLMKKAQKAEEYLRA